MVTRQGGSRKGTRSKLSKRPRDQGKVTISRILKTFEVGDKVRVRPEPAIQKGLPHQRFFNKVGTIVKKKGNAYVVALKDGNKAKQVVALPVHLVKV